jgi:hypothetical protein
MRSYDTANASEIASYTLAPERFVLNAA